MLLKFEGYLKIIESYLKEIQSSSEDLKVILKKILL